MNIPRPVVRALTVAFGTVLTVAAVRAAWQRRHEWVTQGRYTDTEITDEALLAQPPLAVYELLADPIRFADAVALPGQFSRADIRRYRWNGVPGTPPGQVEIVADVPGIMVGWQMSGGPLAHRGTARLDSPDGARTRVEVAVRYRWSHDWAKQSGIADDAPAQVLGAVLERLAASVAPG
jgi:hypothetical protein